MFAMISTARAGSARDGTYTLLHEDTELALIFDVDQLLAAVSRVGAVNSESATSTRHKFSSSREQAPQMRLVVDWKFQHRQKHWKPKTTAGELFGNVHVQLHLVWLSVEIS